MYKRLILAILLLPWIQPAQARTTVDLFLADIPVAREGKQLKAGDARRALAQVLIRITGQSDIITRPEVQQALRQAGRLVFRFRFYQPENAPAGEPPRVEVGFDPDGVRTLMRRLSLPWWPAQRPELLWLTVVDYQGTRSLVNEENLPELREALQTARERGLPLTLPLLDLQDQQQLSAVELWAGFTDRLEQVYPRYGADGWLLLRLQPQGQAWKARWQLHVPGLEPPLFQQWQDVGLELDALLATGVDQASERLARRLAFHLSEQTAGALILNIAHLRKLNDWLQLEQWLNNQPWSESVELLALHQGQARVAVNITTDPATVDRALAESGLLSRNAAAGQSATEWIWSPTP